MLGLSGKQIRTDELVHLSYQVVQSSPLGADASFLGRSPTSSYASENKSLRFMTLLYSGLERGVLD